MFVDNAVWLFGTSMENDIEKSKEGRKSASAKKLAETVAINRWLNLQQFRSPVNAPTF